MQIDKKSMVSLEGLYNLANNKYKIDHALNIVPSKNCLKTKTADELDEKITAEKYLIEPLFKKGEITLLVAKQKTGKSLFALDLSMMLACGGSLQERLTCPTPQKVLYIDVEMPESAIKDRISMLEKNYENFKNYTKNLQFHLLRQEKISINLMDKTQQEQIENTLKGHKLLVLDNLGKLTPRKGEMSEQGWDTIFEWLRKVANKGISILIVHHENKMGQHRGTGKITDDVDLVISLNKNNKRIAGKTKLDITIDSTRYLFDEATEPFTIEYSQNKRSLEQSFKVQDITEKKVTAECFVTNKEINENKLNDLHQTILHKVRASTCVAFKDVNTDDYCRSTITKALQYLVKQKLIKKQGEKRTAKYYPVSYDTKITKSGDLVAEEPEPHPKGRGSGLI